MKVQTFNFGPNCINEEIAFAGLDVRESKTIIYGVGKRDDYQEVHQNAVTGEVVLVDRLGQFSREVRITVYASYTEYKEITEAHILHMARLTGRI